MFLEIITPDEKAYEDEVDSAFFPGIDGSFQVLNDHAPLVSSMEKGDITILKTIDKKTKKTILGISGGVVEVFNNRILVLAESILS